MFILFDRDISHILQTPEKYLRKYSSLTHLFLLY